MALVPTRAPDRAAPPGPPITVALVNDYEIVVEGLRHMLEPFSDRVRVVDLEVCGLPDHPADIALFDTFAARRRVGARVAAMSAEQHLRKVVLYTWDAPSGFVSDSELVDAIILKSVSGEALVDGLERVHAGERIGFDDDTHCVPATALSNREQEVLALLALGLSNRDIADELFLSTDTVKTHVKHLFSKLGVSNRTQAAVAAQTSGLGPPARSN